MGDAVSMLFVCGEGDGAILNLYNLSSDVVPSIVRCFVESSECSRFRIVWYRNWERKRGGARRERNHRLLSGEDADYMLSRTHFVLQNHFYPPIRCQWTFGDDEIQCDATDFVNALRSDQ